MPYVELEQFLDQGSIRILAGLSRTTFGGAVVGGIIGSQVGQALGGQRSLGVVAVTLFGILLGAALMMKRRGIANWKRWGVALLYYARSIRRPPTLDGLAYLTATDEDARRRSTFHQPEQPAAVSADEPTDPAPIGARLAEASAGD